MTSFRGIFFRVHHHFPFERNRARQFESSCCKQISTMVAAKIVSMPRFGGLHHRYDLAA
jgi:hypothetical protein